MLTVSARRIRAAVGGSVVILTYHRVVDTSFDPHQIAVSPDRFAEHVAAFSARYELLSVGAMLRTLSQRRRLPRRGLAITLDDGYADALTHAYPILKANAAPATVFVSTGGLEAKREFWWDELEQLVLGSPLPERLVVPDPAGASRTIDLTPEERSVPAGDPLSPFAGWNVTQPASHPRQHLYGDLSLRLAPQPPAQREKLLDSLRGQIGVTPPVRAEKRSLTAEQVAELARDGLVEIGAHTVAHAWLASLPADEQRAEIAGGKRTLETITGSDVVSFSYPYGSTGSFTPETRRLVREAGFLGAVTTELGEPLPWGSVSFDSDRFALPRTPTSDVSADELIAVIDKRLGL